jgi:hypothetical protein
MDAPGALETARDHTIGRKRKKKTADRLLDPPSFPAKPESFRET